ncbi:MAG: hypothetical protein DRP66_11915 [Planctomycetota bacterium]|nr:MAG: hypothetical protein DRP66_11915 [Planctomycetota bacterium]
MPGCIYEKRGRYYWKVKLPGESDAKARPLVESFCKLDFEPIAQRLYNTAGSEKANAYTCCK